MEDLTISGMIRMAIYEELRWLRHYVGEVIDNDDDQNKGRIKVKIPYLGWDTNDKAGWCWPRQIHSMDVPNIGETVEVYFLEGNRNRPCYFGQVPEIDGNLPASFTDKTDRVIFEDIASGDHVVYDSQTGDLDTLITGQFGVGAGGKDLKTIMDNILTHILNLDTAGSPGAHVLGPTSTANFTQDQADWDAFSKVAK